MNFDQVKQIAGAMLMGIQQPTMEDIQNVAEKIKTLLSLQDDITDIINIITSDIKVYQLTSPIIVDDDEGANWLKEFRATGRCDWKFWTDYKRSLSLPAQAISEIDNSTEKILNSLANPKLEGSWFRSGLVVGHVQSGKTSNFIGLINKAMDVGYKIILVLTGMYSDLRMQTQKRLDKGSIGVITDPESIHFGDPIGVGKYTGHPNVINMTSSSIRGDFGSVSVNVGGVFASSSPTILVCKKNSSILTNILKKFESVAKRATDGLPIVENIPLLIIDDEADSASINTQYDKGEITQINAKIRAILSLFEKRAYVGYTATPYANIFIDPIQTRLDQTTLEIDDRTYRLCKDDLFPKNFIVNLSSPSNYIGANTLWGISSLYDQEEPSELQDKGLPIIEHIKDGFPSRKKNCPPTCKEDLPDSLVEAIKYFFVSTSVRRARGAKQQHCSMLINVSQYIIWQDSIASFVQVLVQEFCDRLGAIDDNVEFEKELKNIYENKIIPSNKTICKLYPDWEPLLPLPTWDKIRQELPIVAAKVRYEVRVLHSGNDTDGLNMTRLNYEEYENCSSEIDNGLYVIAIGGNTMSRGITLEGLMISYFFRTTHTFDALMQMGRWFGYRDGYVDLCRLYLEKDMSANFKNIAIATQEMRDDFDEMSKREIKPRDFGLKVKTFPGVLEVTSRNKFGSAVKGQLSLNKTTLQAYQIYKDADICLKNRDVIVKFLNKLGTPEKRKRNGKSLPHLFWQCNYSDITEFITQFQTATVRMPSNLVTSYIDAQVKVGNLTDWTVVMVNVSRGNNLKTSIKICGTEYIIGASVRGNEASQDAEIYQVANSAVLGPTHESLDLSDDQFKEALRRSVEEWKYAFDNHITKAKSPTSPYAKFSKQERCSSNGLLLLFYMDLGDDNKEIFSYALSLPEIKADHNIVISYEYVGQPEAFNSSFNTKTVFKEIEDGE